MVKLDVKVVGISGDAVNNLKHFKQLNNLNFSLLSDVSGNIAEIFGVPVRKGGEFTQKINDEEIIVCRAHSASRWTFILDKTGKIIYKDTEVDLKKDSKKVISFLQNSK